MLSLSLIPDSITAALLLGCFVSVAFRLADLSPSRQTLPFAVRLFGLGLCCFAALLLPPQDALKAMAIGLTVYLCAPRRARKVEAAELGAGQGQS